MVIQCNLGCFSLGAWFFTTTTTFMLNIEGIYTWKNWVVTWLLGSLTCSVVWAGSMALWVYGLGLRYPAPMVGLWSTGWGLFAQVTIPLYPRFKLSIYSCIFIYRFEHVARKFDK